MDVWGRLASGRRTRDRFALSASNYEQGTGRRPNPTKGTQARGARHLILVVIVVLSAALCRWGSADESPLDGEWEHLTRGIAVWNTADARYAYDTPPLADAATTLVIAGQDGLPDVTTQTHWDGDLDIARATFRTVRRHYATARDALMEARRATTWFLLAGIIYIYGWALRRYGFATAVAAATLVGLNPILLGHAAYLGEDLPAAVTMLVVLGELSRLLSPPQRCRWVLWGTLPAALALALLTSHRAWSLVPVVAVVVIASAWQREQPRARSLLAAVGYLIGLSTMMVLALNLGFFGRDTAMTVGEILERPEPQSYTSARHHHEMLELATPLSRLPRGLRLPLPYTEVFGLGSAWTRARDGDSRAGYRGKRRRHGHWLYFPSLLTLKTPLAVIALLLGGTALAIRRRHGPRDRGVLLLGGAAFAWLLLAMQLTPNIGVGQILHVEIVLCVLAAIAFGAGWRRASSPWLRWGAATLLVLAAVVGVAAGPRHRGYFNPLIGRADGPSISAVGDDEGQDRATLAAVFATANVADRLWIHHGSWATVAELKHLGLSHQPLRCKTMPPQGSFVAVHRRRLQTARRRCFRWRDGRVPLFVVGDHIEVYWLHDISP